MIKLKNILHEEFPKPIKRKVSNWKKSLEKGQLIVKEMGRLSQYDELYQYLGPFKATDDYSNTGERSTSAKVSKIGLILFDHQFGLTIDLYSDDALLLNKLIKLDDDWRFLEKEEVPVLRKALKDKAPYNVDMGANAGQKMDKTYKEIIETKNRCKIIIKREK